MRLSCWDQLNVVVLSVSNYCWLYSGLKYKDFWISCVIFFFYCSLSQVWCKSKVWVLVFHSGMTVDSETLQWQRSFPWCILIPNRKHFLKLPCECLETTLSLHFLPSLRTLESFCRNAVPAVYRNQGNMTRPEAGKNKLHLNADQRCEGTTCVQKCAFMYFSVCECMFV